MSTVDLDAVRRSLRKVDRSAYPELDGLRRETIWQDMGPGGLYLVTRVGRLLDLAPYAWVLDLGCGAATSSIHLAQRFGCHVVAVDLWQDPTENAERIAHAGQRDCVLPMRLDASQPLPFAEGFFDALVVLNNLNFYGTDPTVLANLARLLKPGGMFISGGECLDAEFSEEHLADPPDVYAFHPDVWRDDFLTSHSPDWWATHIAASPELELVSCGELPDGQRFFEEAALISDAAPSSPGITSADDERELELRQIAYGREVGPALTCYLLHARRRDGR